MHAFRLNRRFCGCVAAAALAVVAVPGCGPSNGTVKVTGVAKLTNGTPLPGGRVILTGGATGANGAIKDDGSFTLGTFTVNDGVKPGSYTVVIMGAAQPDTRSYDDRIKGVGKEPPSLIAKKYNAAATSDLKVEIVNGANVLNLTLDPSPAGAAEQESAKPAP